MDEKDKKNLLWKYDGEKDDGECMGSDGFSIVEED